MSQITRSKFGSGIRGKTRGRVNTNFNLSQKLDAVQPLLATIPIKQVGRRV